MRSGWSALAIVPLLLAVIVSPIVADEAICDNLCRMRKEFYNYNSGSGKRYELDDCWDCSFGGGCIDFLNDGGGWCFLDTAKEQRFWFGPAATTCNMPTDPTLYVQGIIYGEVTGPYECDGYSCLPVAP